MRDSGPSHLAEVLRTTGIALRGQMVALWEATDDGHVHAIATGPGRPLSDKATDEFNAALGRWSVPRQSGQRWLGARLKTGKWCIAPVRAQPPRPAPGDVERRKGERMTLELAALCLGLMDGSKATPADLSPTVHDSLTSLPTRAMFLEFVAQALGRRSREPDYQFAVMVLGCDNFKSINDGLGHQAGDQLLVQLGRRLASTTRPADMVARLGGDEFALFLEDAGDTIDAARVADHVQAQIAPPFPVGGDELCVTVSLGVALSSESSGSASDLLRDAGLAMYRAKAQGRSSYELFDPSMRDRALERLNIDMGLRRGLEREEFRLAYQPIVDLRTGHVEGFEALVRWQHPERGLLAPRDFLAAAEESGLMVPLGAWVLREACGQVRRWQMEHDRTDPIRISVNLSAGQVDHGGLLDHVATALRESGLDARCLRLEITEDALKGGLDEVAAQLERLRTLDVQLHLDDFGTGYSSLGYLRRLPLDALKIDRSFVRRLGMRRGDTELVRTIVALAQNLGLDVIAEGVESEIQRDHLLRLGCPAGQGTLFSGPLAPHEVDARIWS